MFEVAARGIAILTLTTIGRAGIAVFFVVTQIVGAAGTAIGRTVDAGLPHIAQANAVSAAIAAILRTGLTGLVAPAKPVIAFHRTVAVEARFALWAKSASVGRPGTTPVPAPLVQTVRHARALAVEA